MANINEEITESNYEIVRDLVGAILTVELANQVQYDEDADLKVWVNRMTEFDQEEIPAINVYLSDLNLNWETIGNGNGELNINIDLHASSVSEEEDGELVYGTVESRKLMEKLARYVMKILMHGSYSRLGLDDTDLEIVNGTEIKRLSFPELVQQDTNYVSFGRVEFGVFLNENANNYEATGVADLLNTEVKLNESDKGYYWTIEN